MYIGSHDGGSGKVRGKPLYLVNFDLTGASDIYKCILITVQMSITPIVISGLVKGSDSIIARMF